jgi:hypothetical protein
MSNMLIEEEEEEERASVHVSENLVAGLAQLGTGSSTKVTWGGCSVPEECHGSRAHRVALRLWIWDPRVTCMIQKTLYFF